MRCSWKRIEIITPIAAIKEDLSYNKRDTNKKKVIRL